MTYSRATYSQRRCLGDRAALLCGAVERQGAAEYVVRELPSSYTKCKKYYLSGLI